MIRMVLLLSLLLGAVLGQRTGECTGLDTPLQWSGDFYESSYNFQGGGGLNIAHYRRGARINYDATNRKLHIREFLVRGSPFPNGRDRVYHEERLILFIGDGEVSYHSVNGECEIVRRFHRQFEPIAIPDGAEYRGDTYVGGGIPFFHDGVAVEVYSTPRNEDDPDAPHYFGTWVPLSHLDVGPYCIPVMESFYRAYGRFGTDDVYTGHLTFYNITAGLDPTAFRIPPSCLPPPPPATKEHVL